MLNAKQLLALREATARASRSNCSRSAPAGGTPAVPVRPLARSSGVDTKGCVISGDNYMPRCKSGTPLGFTIWRSAFGHDTHYPGDPGIELKVGNRARLCDSARFAASLGAHSERLWMLLTFQRRWSRKRCSRSADWRSSSSGVPEKILTIDANLRPRIVSQAANGSF